MLMSMVSILYLFSAFYFFLVVLMLKDKEINSLDKWIYCFPIFFFIFFVSAFREFSQGTDTHAYLSYFNRIVNLSILDGLFVNRFEIGFAFIVNLFSIFNDDPRSFLIYLALMQLGFLYYSVCKVTSGKAAVVVSFAYASLFIIYNLTTNILRQGFAVSFVILSYHYFIENKLLKYLIASTVAALFHKTALICLVIFAGYKYIFSLNRLIILWLGLIASCALGINSILGELLLSVTGLSTEFSYILSDRAYDGYRVGFRFDFILFSAIPVLLFLIIKKIEISSEKYEKYLKLYIVANSIFVFFMFIPYSDRIATYSWSLLPIFFGLFYEAVNESKYSYIGMIILPVALFGLGFLSFLFYPIMAIDLII